MFIAVATEIRLPKSLMYLIIVSLLSLKRKRSGMRVNASRANNIAAHLTIISNYIWAMISLPVSMIPASVQCISSE